MADSEISALPDAGALAGTELVPVVKSGVTSVTTTQAIADLGGGGGGPAIARGTINEDGSIGADAVGIDSCVVQFGGQYDITFTPGFFTNDPVVVASVDIQGASVRCNVEHSATNPNQCRVYVYNAGGTLNTGILQLIAIEGA